MRDLQTIIAANDGAAFTELFRRLHGRDPEPARYAGFLRCDTYTRDLRIRCLSGRCRQEGK